MNGGFGGCNTQVYVIHDLITERRERIVKMFCDQVFVYGVDTIAAEDTKSFSVSPNLVLEWVVAAPKVFTKL